MFLGAALNRRIRDYNFAWNINDTFFWTGANELYHLFTDFVVYNENNLI